MICFNSRPEARRLLAVLGALALVSAEPIPDPTPIQRIQLPADRLPNEMGRAGQPVLSRLPREEFEALVAKAARADAAQKHPPKLLETIYRAALEGDGLSGSAKWKLDHTAEGPGRLNLNSLQLALRSASWSDKSPAVLGSLDGRPGSALELLVNRPGESELQLEWSARGVREPGGVHFELRLPACPVTVVELVLPADRAIQADRDSVVVSGPLPVEEPDKRMWRLSFPRPLGGAPAQFVIRQPSPGAFDPLAQPFIQCTQKLLPGLVDCEFTLDLQVQRGAMEEFVLLCDPGLHPSEVEAPGLESWEAKPGAGGGTQVHLRLRDPIRGGRVIVRALAPLPVPDKTWISPGIQVANGIPRGERLTILVHPDLQLVDWNPGAFRSISTSGSEPMHAISLQRRAVAAESSARPHARILPASSALDVIESLEWKIDLDRMSLTADLRVSGRRGKLSQASWRVPAGWEVEQVDAMPSEAGTRWQIQGKSTLVIEVGTPIVEGKESEERRWLVRLRRPAPTLAAAPDAPAASLPLPDLQPIDGRRRDGRIVVRAHPSLIAVSSESGAVLRPDTPLTYRASPTDSVLIRPRRTRLQAVCNSESFIRQSEVKSTFRLELTPGANAGKELLVSTTAPVSGRWAWKTIDGAAEVQRVDAIPIHEVNPLVAALTSASGLEAALRWRIAELAPSHWWRLVFDRPLHKPTTIELTTSGDGGPRLAIPLLSVAGVDRFDGVAAVRWLPGAAWEVSSNGMREDFGTAHQAVQGWESHTFRYGSMPAALTLRRSETDADRLVRVDRAMIVVNPSTDGRILYRFEFAINGWLKRELPIQLPIGMELISARTNGSELEFPSIAAAKTDGATLRVPWDAESDWGFVELLYSSNRPPGRGWARMNAAVPTLPFPVRPRVVWRLPSGVTPLSLGDWRALPGGVSSAPWPVMRVRQQDSAKSDAQRGMLDEAIRKTPPGASESLGAWLERWTFEHRELVGAIVVDADAFDEAALRPSMLAESKNSADAMWRALGVVPAPGAASLLTTTRQMARWGARVPPSVTDAVAEAIVHGHDSSGRFLTVAEWRAIADRRRGTHGLDLQSEQWTDWESVSDSGSEGPILVETATLSIVGIALAILLGLLGQIVSRGRLLYALVWLSIGALAVIWLPKPLWGLIVWPLAGGAIFALMALVKATWFAAAPNGSNQEQAGQSMSRLTPLGLVVAALLTLPGSAADPEPSRVYLVPASGDREPSAVLAPPDLIERLKEMARYANPAAPSVISAARYDGRIDDSVVHWQAQFTVHCFSDRASPLVVPLAGSRLRQARLDGAETLPRAAGAPEQLAFDVGGRGLHSLQIEFDVPAAGQAERQARCAIPEVPVNLISVQAARAVAFLSAPEARGAQRIVSRDGGSRLESDLGRVAELLIRWHVPGTLPVARPQVEEISMWDLTEINARLRSVFRFKFAATVQDAVEVNVPAGLELTSATLRSLEGLPDSTFPVVIHNWSQLSSGRVKFSFQPALSGQVQLNLELAPRRLDAKPDLRVPTAAGNYERQSYVAVRLQDLQTTVGDVKGWEPEAPDAFLRDLWQPLRVDTSDQEPDHCWRRRSDTAADLRLEVHPAPPSGEAEQRMVWQVGPNRADVRIAATWSEAPPSGPLEWDVPENVVVAEVRGFGLRSWHRSGSRVQAWIGGVPSGGRISLTLWGWVERSNTQKPAEQVFDMPAINLRGSGKQNVFVQVLPSIGWRVFPHDVPGFRSMPSTELPGAGWSGFGDGPGRALFDVYPARGHVDCVSLTEAEPAGRFVTFTGRIDVRSTGVSAASIQTLLVEVRRAETDRLQLQLAPGTRLRETRPTPTGVTWVVDCLPGQHRFTVTGRVTMLASREAAMPSVWAHGAGDSPPPRRWVMTGPGIRVREAAALRPENPPAELLDRQQADRLRQGGTAWSVQADGWRLRFEVSPAGMANVGPLAASPAEVTAAAGDDGNWRLQAVFFIFHEAEGPWSVRLPVGQELLYMAIDGVEPQPPPAKNNIFTTPSFRPGLHAVRIVWQSDAGNRAVPPLKLPRLEVAGQPVTIPSVLWSVNAPRGLRFVPVKESIGPVAFELQRAASTLEFHGRIAPLSGSEGLMPLRSMMQSALRRAEYAFANSPNSAAEHGPDGQALGDWLKQLRDAAPPADPVELAVGPYSEPYYCGHPVHWRTSSPDAPVLRVESTDPERADRVIMTVILALVMLLGTFIVRRTR